MLKKKRYLFLIVFLIGIVIFLSGPKVVAPAVSRMLVNFAAARGVGLSIEELHLGSGVSGAALRIWTRKISAIELKNFLLRPVYSELIGGKLRLIFNAEYLNGVIRSSLALHGENAFNLAGSVTNVQLAEHPYFSTLPLNGGIVNIKADSLVISEKDISGVANASIDSLTLSEPVTLPTFITGLPIPVDIPTFELKDVSSSVLIQSNHLSLPDIVVHSDLLSFRGQLKAILPNMVMIDGDGCLQLTARGVEKIGALLPFVGGASSTAAQSIVVKGNTLKRATVSFKSDLCSVQ